MKTLRENLSSVLSLSRLQNKEFKPGDVFQVAGRVEYHDATQTILKGQGKKQSFLQGLSKPSHPSISLQKNQCVLLTVQVSLKNEFLIQECKILTNSKKELPDFDPESFKKWHAFLREVENFFIQEGLCPVQTPSLVECPGTEPQLKFLSTTVNGKKTWLASSPELSLKKLLFRNATDIFEIHKCYRNNEKGNINWNEFYMLEWYRSYASMDHIIQDTQRLLFFLKEKGFFLDEVQNIQKLFIPDLFQKHCGFCLFPESTSQDLISFLKTQDIRYSEKDSFEDLFHLIFLNFIEPHFNPEIPTFVYGYPPSLRAYSRLNEEGWANRFELYWKNMELANGFDEIYSPQIQRKVFEEDLKKHPDKDLKIDESFLKEMECGFPPTVGIALGVERLYMAGCHLKSFPLYSNSID